MNIVDKETGEHLVSLLYRPSEPIFFPKNGRYFEIPEDYAPVEYRRKMRAIYANLRKNHKELQKVVITLNSPVWEQLLNDEYIERLQLVSQNERFSVLFPLHKSTANSLINTFLDLKTKELLPFAVIIRDQINAELFNYAFCIALMHREDTKHLKLLSHAESFPEKFIPSQIVAVCKQQAKILNFSPDDRMPVEIPRDTTGNILDPEHPLAYFREDIGINLYYWHWHLLYPAHINRARFDKNRRGELFYYVNHQILVRYNIERLCNALDLVKPIIDLKEPIEEGYFPNLSNKIASPSWASRPPNIKLDNVDRSDVQLKVNLEEIRNYKRRIQEAINNRRVLKTNGEIEINNERGIDVLGNIVEGNVFSPHLNYYGSLHKLGQSIISFIHDPENDYNQPPGVMASPATAMRDPICYRWNAVIDDIFLQYKNTLLPYSERYLSLKGITITSLKVLGKDQRVNVLKTFMKQTDYDMTRGLDFVPPGKIPVRITHLDHEDFVYNINVENSTSRIINGIVRIFLGPSVRSNRESFSLAEQKNLMIQMDKFQVELRPGHNTIERISTESNLIMPFEQIFPRINDKFTYKANVCGCGWPQHMLLPKGTSDGYPMVLFVMISDYDNDKVEQPIQYTPANDCKQSVSFCGLKDKSFTDKQAMGYPFDRPIRNNIRDLRTFLTSNMKTADITIYHLPSHPLATPDTNALTLVDFETPDNRTSQS